jgi:hypothetical protein
LNEPSSHALHDDGQVGGELWSAAESVDSKEDAMKAAKHFMELHIQHWPGWEGEAEVRQIYGPNDFPGGE